MDAVLQVADEVVISHLDYLEFALGLLSLQPSVALALWVHHQRPSPGIRHYYRVLNGEVVVGKAVHVPLPYFYRVAQHFRQGGLSRVYPEGSLIELLYPLFKYALTEGLCKGPEITDLCAGDEDADVEGLLLLLVLLAEEVPTHLLVL